jgi:hypothetical protein
MGGLRYFIVPSMPQTPVANFDKKAFNRNRLYAVAALPPIIFLFTGHVGARRSLLAVRCRGRFSSMSCSYVPLPAVDSTSRAGCQPPLARLTRWPPTASRRCHS